MGKFSCFTAKNIFVTIQSSSIDSLYHINIFPSLIEEDRLCVVLTDDQNQKNYVKLHVHDKEIPNIGI